MSLVELNAFNNLVLAKNEQEKATNNTSVVTAPPSSGQKGTSANAGAIQPQHMKLAPHNLKPNMSVSIVTPTHVDRLHFMELCFYMVNYQDSNNIKEWIILDSSKTKEGQNLVKRLVHKLAKKYKKVAGVVKYKPYPLSHSHTLGAIRNFYNQLVVGDVVVCFDDDDFYTERRVSHAVSKFAENPNIHLLASSALCIYDVDLDIIYKFKKMHDNHGTNNTFAYTRLYALTRRYDETKEYGEEAVFTNDFTEPAVQLCMYDSVLNIAHAQNTVNKRKNIVMNYLYPSNIRYITETPYQLSHFVNCPQLLSLFKHTLKLDVPRENWEQCPFDIVYYCGLSMPWKPTDTNLGGSEQAVLQLSEQWASLGYNVAVYTTLSIGDHAAGDSLSTDVQQWKQSQRGLIEHNKVHYFSYQQFKLKRRYNTVILWRPAGIMPFVKMNLNCSNLLIDMHDNFTMNSEDCLRMIDANLHRIDYIMLKSTFHKECLKMAAAQFKLNADAFVSKSVVLGNGVRVNQFSKCPEGVVRHPHRFCYTSCYTRGLRELLLYTWPIIKENIPDAELHVYYGMDMVPNKEFIEEMRWLLKCNGVTEYGRQGMDSIITEKYRSSFHLYFTASPSETDCIAVRESLVTGCIPILSVYNVFAERDGIHIKTPTLDDKAYQQVGAAVVSLLNSNTDSAFENLREQCKNSKTLTTWEDVAKEWECLFKQHIK